MKPEQGMETMYAARAWESSFGGCRANYGTKETSDAFGAKLAEKRTQCADDSVLDSSRLGKAFLTYRWKPGSLYMGKKRDGYWKSREERRKKLRKLYRQKLEKEALARRLAQERYDAEVSVINARRSRLLWSEGKEGSGEQVSPGAIDYEANVIAQTMLSSLFRK